VAKGVGVPRPEGGDRAPNGKITELLKINALIASLTADVPPDPKERCAAAWPLDLANVLDWHRREEKAVWWELFQLSDLSAEDLLEEQAGYRVSQLWA
jgi:uncharacterized protein